MDTDTEMTFARLEDALLSSSPQAITTWFREQNAPAFQLFTVFKKTNDDNTNSDESKPDESSTSLLANSDDLVGTTPIHYSIAFRKESPAIFDVIMKHITTDFNQNFSPPILQQILDWDVVDDDGFSPLALAISRNDKYAVEKLVKAGASIETSCSVPPPTPLTEKEKEAEEEDKLNTNALGLAVAFGSMDVFRLLLDLGADTNVWDSSGKRPIHLAVQYGKLDALQHLMSLDLPIDELPKTRIMDMYLVREDFDNQHHCKKDDDDDDDNCEYDNSNNGEDASSFVRGGGDAASDDDDTEPTFSAPWSEGAPNMYDDDGNTDSEEEDDDEAVLGLEDIIDFQRQLSEVGLEVRTDQAGNINITARFTGPPRDDGSRRPREDKDYGSNLLHLACKYKHAHIVHFLLTAGRSAQNINDKRGDGMTALHIASRNNDVNIMRLLVEEGSADVSVPNDILGMCPIHIACENGATEALDFLLNHGAKSDSRDDSRFCPLHYAASIDTALACVDKLLSAGADVNAMANDRETPLYTAIARWNLAPFWKLIEAGGNPGIAHADGTVVIGFIAANSMTQLAKFADFVANNSRIKEFVDMDVIIGDEGQTALHIAARDSCSAAVENLVKAGASTTKLDDNGASALLTMMQNTDISRYDAVRIMTALIQGGTDVNLMAPDGARPLHYVCEKNLHPLIPLMVEKGVELNATYQTETALHVAALNKDHNAIENLLHYGADPSITDSNSMTPLLICAKNHCWKGLEALVKKGASVNQKDKNGATALHLAGTTYSHDVSKVVEILYKAGANINERNKEGKTPLHLHIEKKRTEGVRTLIKAVCDLNALTTSFDISPLMHACQFGHIEAARLLLQAGADINFENSSKNTAIYYFADSESKSIRMLRLLLAAGANINHRDKDGDTVLQEAALNNYPTIIRFLMHHGADVNSRNDDMETAVFQAAKNGFVEAVEVLLTDFPTVKGADPRLCNRNGTSPYQIARSEGHSEVIPVLLKAMKVTLSTFAPLSKYAVPSPTTSGSLQIEGTGPEVKVGRTICAVCQDELHFGEEVRRLPCGHEFHDPCILPWIGGEQMTNSKSCPVCKQPVAPTNL